MSFPGKRAENRAEKEADLAINSLQVVETDEIESTIEAVCEKLRGKPKLLFRLTKFLKSGTIIEALLDGTMTSEADPEETPCKKARKELLRMTWSKWEHLLNHDDVVDRLHEVAFQQERSARPDSEESTTNETTLAKDPAKTLNKLQELCLKLLAHKSDPLPSKHYHMTNILDLEKAIIQRVEITQKAFEGFQPSVFQKGLFEKCPGEDTALISPFDKKETKTKIIFRGCMNLAIEDPYDPKTKITYEENGLQKEVKNIKQVFENKGIHFPSFEPKQWQLSEFTLKENTKQATPKKKTEKTPEKKKEDMLLTCEAVRRRIKKSRDASTDVPAVD